MKNQLKTHRRIYHETTHATFSRFLCNISLTTNNAISAREQSLKEVLYFYFLAYCRTLERALETLHVPDMWMPAIRSSSVRAVSLVVPCDPPLSAGRGNEGRRVANCTDSRKFSVSRRSFQYPHPDSLALLSGASTPLSTTAATTGAANPSVSRF